MLLSGDKGVGDGGGDNLEDMREVESAVMHYAWIVFWDYGADHDGEGACLAQSNVYVLFMDVSVTSNAVSIDSGDTENAFVYAVVDSTISIG
jgi:hypothetical protein